MQDPRDIENHMVEPYEEIGEKPDPEYNKYDDLEWGTPEKVADDLCKTLIDIGTTRVS